MPRSLSEVFQVALQICPGYGQEWHPVHVMRLKVPY